MNKSEKQNYRLLPEWTVIQTDKSLIISGGADARYEIELENDEKSFFASLKYDQTFNRSSLIDRDQRVLEELITAEIIVPELQKGKVLKFTVMGDDNKLILNTGKQLLQVKDDQVYDLALIVRTNSTYADLLGKINYQSINKTHLLVDTAFHHTLSLGPLVFPGETACIACLQGRVSNRWGDEVPPIVPQITKNYAGVASELIATELARIAAGDTGLTNKTISWNFLDRATKKDQLLKVPLCPICSQNKIDQRGALALPWSKA